MFYCSYQKIQRINPFDKRQNISNLVRLIAPSALKRGPSALDHACLRSSALNYSIIPQHSRECDGTKVTRGSRVYVVCAQSQVLGSSIGALERITLGLIACALDRSICTLMRTNRDQIFLSSFPPFKPHFDANDL